jgi:serine/threonine-protein kinase/endoribonuclease IRE1
MLLKKPKVKFIKQTLKIFFSIAQNIKSDVYSIGCLAYFILNDGQINLNSDLTMRFEWDSFKNADTSDGVCARHLISVMTVESPDEKRPSIACSLFHPFFWNNEKILEFFINVSNRLEMRDALSNKARSLFQEDAQNVTNGNWIDSLDSVVQASLPHRNRMNYDGYSVENLIRALRNKKNHYDDMTYGAKQVYGAIPDGFTQYWLKKFPKLLLHIYLKFYQSGLNKEPNFSQFYPQTNICGVKEID